MESENILRLKKKRSSKKGILTRVQNEIKGLILNSDNYDLVKDRIEEFKQLLQEFKEAHAAYQSQLSDENVSYHILLHVHGKRKSPTAEKEKKF